MNAIEPTAAQEVGPLVRELAAALRSQLAFYQKHYKLSLDDAAARYYEKAEDYEAILDATPPDQLGWDGLNFLCERSPVKGCKSGRKLNKRPSKNS